MNATQFAGGLQMKQELLLVCDVAGRVQAASSASANGALPIANLGQKHFAEIFGRDSKITEWLTEQINEARKRESFSAQSYLEDESAPVEVRLDSLRSDGELFGYALSVRPAAATSSARSLEEGDAIIFRSQWHEIKNQVGALKLYATYLIRKMPDSEDRQTIEKMLNGINGLIDYLAQIRRGEAH
jgi:hypothetical protein